MNIIFPIKKKKVAKYKYLEEKYGGKWKYCRGSNHRWECDDGRCVQSYSCTSFTGYESYYSEYWMIGNGMTPMRINL